MLNVVKFTSTPQTIRRSESSLLFTLILICHFFQTHCSQIIQDYTECLCLIPALMNQWAFMRTALCNVWIMMLADVMLLNDYHCFAKWIICNQHCHGYGTFPHQMADCLTLFAFFLSVEMFCFCWCHGRNLHVGDRQIQSCLIQTVISFLSFLDHFFLVYNITKTIHL